MEQLWEYLSSDVFIIFLAFLIGFFVDIRRRPYVLKRRMLVPGWITTGIIYSVCSIFFLPFLSLKMKSFISTVLISIVIILVIFYLNTKIK